MKGELPRDPIGYGALALLGLSVVIHFTVGVSELVGALTGHGVLAYALMLLAAAALPIVLMGAMVSGVLQPNATYATLSGVFAFYLFAYVDVHALGTMESVSGADLHSHDHSHDGHAHDDHSDHGHDDGHAHDDGHSHDDGHTHDDHSDHTHDDGHNDHGHSHDGSTVDVVAEHLIADPLALISKVAEGTAMVLFALLALRKD